MIACNNGEHTLVNNVVMSLQGAQMSLVELAETVIKRVSVGSALAWAALGAFLRAATEMRDDGTYTFAAEAVGLRELSGLF